MLLKFTIDIHLGRKNWVKSLNFEAFDIIDYEII